jgi:outer membrane receptor protein involved in Fe transport
MGFGSALCPAQGGPRKPSTAPGYTIVNLAANYEVNEHFSAFGRIDNLFDVRYQNPTGFLAPGLGVFGGLKVTFGEGSL